MHSYPVPERVPEGKLYVCRNEAIMTEVQEQDHANLPPSQIQYPVQTCVGVTLFIPLLDPNHLLSTTAILIANLLEKTEINFYAIHWWALTVKRINFGSW